MYIRLSEREIEEMIRNYYLEIKNIKNAENFYFSLKIEFHDGTYDYDSYYTIDSKYYYCEEISIFGKKHTLSKIHSLTSTEISEIMDVLFEREGYKKLYGIYFENGIEFKVEKIDQMKLVKGINNESN